MASQKEWSFSERDASSIYNRRKRGAKKIRPRCLVGEPALRCRRAGRERGQARARERPSRRERIYFPREERAEIASEIEKKHVFIMWCQTRPRTGETNKAPETREAIRRCNGGALRRCRLAKGSGRAEGRANRVLRGVRRRPSPLRSAEARPLRGARADTAEG